MKKAILILLILFSVNSFSQELRKKCKPCGRKKGEKRSN